jgi:hypothetical protein
LSVKVAAYLKTKDAPRFTELARVANRLPSDSDAPNKALQGTRQKRRAPELFVERLLPRFRPSGFGSLTFRFGSQD